MKGEGHMWIVTGILAAGLLAAGALLWRLWRKVEEIRETFCLEAQARTEEARERMELAKKREEQFDQLMRYSG